MSKNILIFGNGISLRYAKNSNEYKYNNLALKLLEGLKIWGSIEPGQKSGTDTLIKELKKMISSNKNKGLNFNESLFFDLWKHLFILFLDENFIGKNVMGYKSGKQFYNIYYKFNTLKETKPINLVAWTWAHSAYRAICYSIKFAVSINKENNDWIQINYDDFWKKKLKCYDKIMTTNYYVGFPNENNITFLHGKIEKIPSFVFTDQLRNREKTCGEEFTRRNNILFGGTYKEKAFLNSLLNSGSEELKYIPISSDEINKIDYSATIDFVGISLNAEQDLFLEFAKKCKNINIYFHTEDDKKEFENWKKNNNLSNVSIIHNKHFFNK